ncbi:alpha/beta hydrolase [Microbispora rosea subsp. aerata]|nr:alpha/beta hydrolase [Microbispora rosea]GGO01430.1 alpha/beta hydrolase [Microbispora rosea subsp. aerata]GIH58361.1 alpha/beta hydrolase [Microbispora rosea subsp. aerata]GLJ87127.1 alpha/beta hydrolase [Microbispora rosea subsp. aerata]
MRATANGIEICYEVFGEPGGRPVVLIMGLGAQMISWPEEFIGLLVESGHRVVRFDNRDVGLSTHFTPADDVTRPASYTLDDMADDVAGLMDVLDWHSAHVVGASMGGMIAQALAIRHPARVRTLTSIMSTPAPHVGRATEAALAALMAPPPQNRDEAIARAVATARVVGSPGYELDVERVTRVAAEAYDRAFDPGGTARQFTAIRISGDRTEGLRGLSIPALVIHGEDDPLVTLEGGIATADAIPGAKLLTFPGMGHDLPRPLWPAIAEAIAELTGRS